MQALILTDGIRCRRTSAVKWDERGRVDLYMNAAAVVIYIHIDVNTWFPGTTALWLVDIGNPANHSTAAVIGYPEGGKEAGLQLPTSFLTGNKNFNHRIYCILLLSQ